MFRVQLRALTFTRAGTTVNLYDLILCFVVLQHAISQKTLREKSKKRRSNETPTLCNTVQVLFLQGHSTCFGRKRPSSGVFKTGTAVTGTCVIVAGQSSQLLIRAELNAL